MPEHLCQRVKKCPLRLRTQPRGPVQELREAQREIFLPTWWTLDLPQSLGSAPHKALPCGHGTRREVQPCLARSARRRTRLRSHPAHPKPTASTPGSLQALLFLQGMLREPSPSDAPSFWLPGVRGASTKNRTQTPRHTVLCRSWSQRLPVTG